MEFFGNGIKFGMTKRIDAIEKSHHFPILKKIYEKGVEITSAVNLKTSFKIRSF